MNHFGSTFILCFLCFLFIQANAIPSLKTCSADSDCQATGEFCEELQCQYNYIPSPGITLTSSSVLTYVKQQAGEDVATCPSFDACAENCRKEYSVEKTPSTVALTSTFADTTDCVCDKVVLRYRALSGDVHLSWMDRSSSTYFGTSADTVFLRQYSAGALDIYLWQESVSPTTVDCVWEYSIGTVSSPPPPPSPLPPPSSSSTATLTGLLGLVSASVVAFVLV